MFNGEEGNQMNLYLTEQSQVAKILRDPPDFKLPQAVYPVMYLLL